MEQFSVFCRLELGGVLCASMERFAAVQTPMFLNMYRKQFISLNYVLHVKKHRKTPPSCRSNGTRFSFLSLLLELWRAHGLPAGGLDAG